MLWLRRAGLKDGWLQRLCGQAVWGSSWAQVSSWKMNLRNINLYTVVQAAETQEKREEAAGKPAGCYNCGRAVDCSQMPVDQMA